MSNKSELNIWKQKKKINRKHIFCLLYIPVLDTFWTDVHLLWNLLKNNKLVYILVGLKSVEFELVTQIVENFKKILKMNTSHLLNLINKELYSTYIWVILKICSIAIIFITICKNYSLLLKLSQNNNQNDALQNQITNITIKY